MAQFFKPIELPEYCFLSEAVEWLAIGAVPEAQWESISQNKTQSSNSNLVEYRFEPKFMPENFQPKDEIIYFGPEEFRFVGVPFEAGYIEAAEICDEQQLKHREKWIEKLKKAEDLWVSASTGELVDINAIDIKRHKAALRKNAAALALVEKVELAFKPHFDAAWARLFNALVEGHLSIEGIDYELWIELKEQQDYSAAAKSVTLPVSAFQLDIDWRRNAILHDWRDFVSLRCNTIQVTELLIPKLLRGTAVEARKSGDYLWTSEAGGDRKRPVKRGRTPAVDWSQLREHLLDLARGNQLPESKESCIYHLIAFSEKELGKKVGRSTVQDHFKHELSSLYSRD